MQNMICFVSVGEMQVIFCVLPESKHMIVMNCTVCSLQRSSCPLLLLGHIKVCLGLKSHEAFILFNKCSFALLQCLRESNHVKRSEDWLLMPPLYQNTSPIRLMMNCANHYSSSSIKIFIAKTLYKYATII